MRECRVSVKRTVFYDEDTGRMCVCDGNFWKTCSLRVVNRLSCKESIISITPIERDTIDPAADSVRVLDKSLAHLEDGLRGLKNKLKI